MDESKGSIILRKSPQLTVNKESIILAGIDRKNQIRAKIPIYLITIIMTLAAIFLMVFVQLA